MEMELKIENGWRCSYDCDFDKSYIIVNICYVCHYKTFKTFIFIFNIFLLCITTSEHDKKKDI